MQRTMAWAGLVALGALAAGCIGPDAGNPTGSMLGYCPQWEQGPGQEAKSVELDDATREMAADVTPPSLTLGRRALDLYRLRLDSLDIEGGQLELRATTGNGTGRNWFDYRSAGQPFQSVPYLVFRGGGNETGHEFDVILSPIQQADATNAAPIQLTWRFVPDGSGGSAKADYTVTFHYRVCGAGS